MATTTIKVDVTVDNVKWKKKIFGYTGKFTYTQTDPAPGPGTTYVTPSGNMFLSNLPDEAEVILYWKTPQVSIGSSNYAAKFLHPNTGSVRLAQGMGNKPIFSPPDSGSQISVPPGVDGTSLKIMDKNDDGETYTFNLIVYIDNDGGQYLIDDPIIENRGGPPRDFIRAEPATSADPGEPGDGATPGDPATPPDPSGKNDG